MGGVYNKQSAVRRTDVADAAVKILLDREHLVDNLVGLEAAGEAALAGGAEGAPHRAADLHACGTVHVTRLHACGTMNTHTHLRWPRGAQVGRTGWECTRRHTLSAWTRLCIDA